MYTPKFFKENFYRIDGKFKVKSGVEIRDENALDRGDSGFENPLSPLKTRYPTYYAEH